MLLHRGFSMAKSMAATLEMVVAENRAAHDGEIGVAAHKVVGNCLTKSAACGRWPYRSSWGVMPIQNDAVLVVVDIGAVLEEPVLLIDGDGDDPVVLPGGVVEPSRVALVLPAELALGVAGLGRGLRRGDGLGVLLRLGQVDGDVHIPVGCDGLPLYIRAMR